MSESLCYETVFLHWRPKKHFFPANTSQYYKHTYIYTQGKLSILLPAALFVLLFICTLFNDAVNNLNSKPMFIFSIFNDAMSNLAINYL
jgi:hypothetical protein